MTTAGDESQDTQQMPNSSATDSLDDSLFGSQTQQEGHDGEGEGDGEEEEEKEVTEGKGKSKGKGKGGKKEQKKKTAGKKKKEEVEICTVRDPIARVPLPSDGGGGKKSYFTVLSWNVNGLRATVKNGLEVLRRMVETERPDLVCFQVRLLPRHASTVSHFYQVLLKEVERGEGCKRAYKYVRAYMNM